MTYEVTLTKTLTIKLEGNNKDEVFDKVISTDTYWNMFTNAWPVNNDYCFTDIQVRES